MNVFYVMFITRKLNAKLLTHINQENDKITGYGCLFLASSYIYNSLIIYIRVSNNAMNFMTSNCSNAMLSFAGGF